MSRSDETWRRVLEESDRTEGYLHGNSSRFIFTQSDAAGVFGLAREGIGSLAYAEGFARGVEDRNEERRRYEEAQREYEWRYHCRK